MLIYQTVSQRSTLANWACNTLRRSGVLRWPLRLFAGRCWQPTRKKSLTLTLGVPPPAHEEEWIVPKGLPLAQGMKKCQSSPFKALRPSKIRESRVRRRLQRSPVYERMGDERTLPLSASNG